MNNFLDFFRFVAAVCFYELYDECMMAWLAAEGK